MMPNIVPLTCGRARHEVAERLSSDTAACRAEQTAFARRGVFLNAGSLAAIA